MVAILLSPPSLLSTLQRMLEVRSYPDECLDGQYQDRPNGLAQFLQAFESISTENEALQDDLLASVFRILVLINRSSLLLSLMMC